MSEQDKPFHNPFEVLRGLGRTKSPAAAGSEGAVPSSEEQAPAPRRGPAVKVIARAVVRLERSGRGGKEVTVIEQLDLRPSEREDWLKALKSALGCGGHLEGDTLVVQGDHRARVRQWLVTRGVKKVIGST